MHSKSILSYFIFPPVLGIELRDFALNYIPSPSCVILSCFIYFETGPHEVNKLPSPAWNLDSSCISPLECWDYRPVLSCTAFAYWFPPRHCLPFDLLVPSFPVTFTQLVLKISRLTYSSETRIFTFLESRENWAPKPFLAVKGSICFVPLEQKRKGRQVFIVNNLNIHKLPQMLMQKEIKDC